MSSGPPRFAVRLLRLLVPRSLEDDAVSDLADLHHAWATRMGARAADRKYWLELPGFVLRLRIAWLQGRLQTTRRSRDRPHRRPSMATLPADLRYAMRTLRRNPAFTAIAVLTLALGIGANTAIFSVIRTVLLRPLPFPDADRIVQIWETRLDRGWDESSFTHANFWDVRDMNQTFDAIGAAGGRTFNLTGFEYPEQLRGEAVSAGFLNVLGVTPVLGRTFAPGEDEPGAGEGLVMLSYALWTRRFGSDPSVLGRSLTLDDRSYTVIGVLPRARPWLDAPDVFVPLVHRSDADRGSFELSVIGRMKPGVTFETALNDLQGVALRLAQRYPEPDAGMGITIQPSSQWIADEGLRRSLWILMGGVGLLLLIACVNLANLMLARATAHSRERALRAALGASRGRNVSLVLAESAVLGTGGAVVGLLLAFALVSLMRTYDPGNIPRLADVAIDGWILAFTVGVALLTSLLTGLVPALRTPYGNLTSGLREGDRSMTGSRHQGKLRSALVGAEVAMSLVMLAGAGLLLRSFAEVLNVDRGFQSEDRVFFQVALPNSYQDSAGVQARQFRSAVLSRIEGMAGVTSAAAINQRPLAGVGVGMGFSAADRPRPEGDAVPWASWRLITPGYFRAMGVPLIAGRDFVDRDEAGGERWRVVISRRIAHELWPGENAIGRTIRLWEGQEGPEAEVIGVVADMLDWGLERGASYAVYIPFNGTQWTGINFVLYATAGPSAMVPRLRTMLAEIDPNLPLTNVQTLDEMIGRNVASRRFIMILLASFAGVALLLALAGVYGVLSYSVAQRRSEIGMRLALGASRGHVKRLIVVQGMRPVVVGLVLGLAGALVVSRLLSTLLFGITPADLPTYAGVAALLAVTAALSAFLPARSAVRLDVLAALREE